MAVGGDLAVPGVRLGDDGVHLLLGQLGDVHRIGQGEHAARGHELDEVGAILDLIAHRRAAFRRAVADPLDGAGRLDAVRREGGLVGVPARRADGVVGDQHARPFRDPGVDGVAQAERHVVDRADVAHGGEAGLQGPPGVEGGVVGLLGGEAHDVLEEVAVPVVRHLHVEVDVGVDEAGQEGRVAEVDHPRAGRRRQVLADLGDVIPLDDHHAGGQGALRGGGEDARGLEHDRRGGRPGGRSGNPGQRHPH
jgi:hypothetical protein